jgi:hypothetical protein
VRRVQTLGAEEDGMFKRRAKSALVRHSTEAGNLGHQSSVSGQQDASIKVIREAGAPASDAPAEAYLLPVRTRSCVCGQFWNLVLHVSYFLAGVMSPQQSFLER